MVLDVKGRIGTPEEAGAVRPFAETLAAGYLWPAAREVKRSDHHLERLPSLKPRPNHALYIRILRRMSPEERLRKAFELNELGRELFREGLRRRYPELSSSELKALEWKRLEKCHNRSY